MEKNTSSFSICKKIRQVLASNPAFRAIHRIKQYSRPATNHSNSPSSPPTHVAKNTAIRANPPLPQHIKVNTEGGGAIPINFDYTTPTSTGNGNSEICKLHGQASKVASPHVGNSERAGKVVGKVEHEPYVPRQGKHPTKVEVVLPTNKGTEGQYNGKAYKEDTPGTLKGQHGLGMQHSEKQGKISLDINDTFTEFIQRTKSKIKTVSNVGKGQSNSAPDEGNDIGTNKMENQKDQFSDINQAKKKLRSTSSIGKTSSLKRG